MNTNYAAPVDTFRQDAGVPVAEWEKLLMVWTLRSLNPAADKFTTLSFAIQQDGETFRVVERVDGMCTSTANGDFTLSQTFEGADAKSKALSYFMEQIRCATPPCRQGALPGLVEAAANFVETYAYFGGYGGSPCNQSHVRVGGWN
jgi:hypothetical protein